jgi:hypothetical protein
MRRVVPIIGGVAVVVVAGVVWWGGPWAAGDEGAAGTPSMTSTTIGGTVVEDTDPTTTETEVVTSITEPSRPTTTVVAATTTPEAEPPVSTVTTLRPTTTTVTADFVSSVSPVTADDLHASWRPGCPVDVEDLRALDVTYLGFDGEAHTGRLIVAATVADDMAGIMGDLYASGFPIQRMEPVDLYDGDDDASMAANNTSAFNCRAVTGGSSWSEHSYGTAIDVNPLVNPYVRGSTVLPPEGRRYADRTRDDPGMIHAGDATVEAFSERGWIWGGTWSSPKDYQHFSTSGR